MSRTITVNAEAFTKFVSTVGLMTIMLTELRDRMTKVEANATDALLLMATESMETINADRIKELFGEENADDASELVAAIVNEMLGR